MLAMSIWERADAMIEACLPETLAKILRSLDCEASDYDDDNGACT
jgi:hypothetical protein